MIWRFIKWRRKRVTWRAAHRIAWTPAVALGADGLTLFQQQAAAAYQAVVPSASLTRSGASDPFLTGTIPSTTAAVFIYRDGAEVAGGVRQLRAERWDFESPEALVEAFLASVSANLQTNQPLHRDASSGLAAAVVAGERRR